MRIEELSGHGISEFYINKIREEKISELYPPQADIVRKNLLKDRNLVVSIPTASGKTLMASLAIIKKFSETRCKALYIVPLVALANEKFSYFKNMFGDKYKVAMSVGDFDSSDPWLAERDIIVCTTEKLDSLTRHGASWLGQVGLVIVDEIHMLNDPGRGPTLEILLTKMRQLAPRAQVIGLSATIKNTDELAKWMNANLVVSDFRPVKLHEGIAFDSKMQFFSHRTYELADMEPEAAIIQNTMQMDKQALFFVSSRRNAEALAERLAKTVNSMVSAEDKKSLSKLSQEVLGVLENPTRQCNRLAFCIKHGTAFHHAGLMSKQKRLIEDSFRKGLIKVITSTPTLALGVNLPAFRVVIRDAKRYYAGAGNAYIPVMEYRQMSGRAGRPQYDEFGEALLIAKTEDEAFELAERFIHGDVEEIKSKLAVEPVLRMHTLALIASGFAKTESSILDFFSKTFYSFQYGDSSAIDDKITKILGELVEWGFIEYSRESIEATKIGKRVSELYIDPLTAHNFVEDINAASGREHNYFSFLHAVCSAREMEPKLSPKTSEFADIAALLSERGQMFLREVPEEWDLEFDDFVRSVKTATLFEAWVDEKTDDQILTEFRIAPGEMRNRINTADWLVYSMQELSVLLGQKKLLGDIRKLRVRLKHGVKEELVPLVRLKQVGRIRARKLYRAGLRSLNDLRKAPTERIAAAVGAKVANSIKKQVGESRTIQKLT